MQKIHAPNLSVRVRRLEDVCLSLIDLGRVISGEAGALRARLEVLENQHGPEGSEENQTVKGGVS